LLALQPSFDIPPFEAPALSICDDLQGMLANLYILRRSEDYL
jgi:hypothetical protein